MEDAVDINSASTSAAHTTAPCSDTDMKEIQEENTAKLVLNAYFKVMNENGATAQDVTRHLLDKFGNIWKLTALSAQAEKALQSSAALGFMKKHGDRYVAELTREACGARPRRCRRRKRSCRRRRRRSCRRRRRRRSRPCCCK